MLRQLEVTQRELQALVEGEARTKIQTTQHRLYESGDRAGKLLAWLSRKEREANWVNQIEEAGTRHTTAPAIVEAFAHHYTNLYAAQLTTGENSIDDYLKAIDMPTLQTEDSAALEAEITLEEVSAAIAKQKSGKTPGPNGLPGEFFKQNNNILAPRL